MPWSFVDHVLETKRFLLIYHGYSKEPFYIPKQALSPANKVRLFALLREHARTQHEEAANFWRYLRSRLKGNSDPT
jgi:hypothetical protein